MSSNINNKKPQDTALYPIRMVSDLTKVNPVTLRAWERRHGLIEPVRKDSGHRLYTQAHIDLIIRVVGLLDNGMRIGQIKTQLEAENAAHMSSEQVIDGTWKRYIERMTAAVIQFNEAKLEEAYGEALALYPIDKVTEKLLKPLLAELGHRWEKDQGSIAEEHFFSFYLRNKLGARFHHRTNLRNGPRLLLACLPGDRHEAGLLLFALTANSAGYQTILLGSDMPLDKLVDVVQKTGCKAIVLSGILQPGSETLNHALPALTRQSPVPVFLGGHASVQVHDALKRAGVEMLGTDLNSGLQKLRNAVPFD